MSTSIGGLGFSDPLFAGFRRTEGEYQSAFQNVLSNPTNLGDQISFTNAVSRRAQTVSITEQLISARHNAQRSILNAF